MNTNQNVGPVSHSAEAVVAAFKNRKPLYIGGMNKATLLARVKSVVCMDMPDIGQLLLQPQVKTEGLRIQIITIRLTPRMLGLPGGATLTQMIDSGRLAVFSREHADALQGQMVYRLGAEAGPQLRWQYAGQSTCEDLHIAMEPILVGGLPSIYTLICDKDNDDWLFVTATDDHFQKFGADEEFLYQVCLPN